MTDDTDNVEEALARFDPPTGLLMPQVAADKARHPLHSPFAFWYVKRVHGARAQENYERNIRRLAVVSDLESFWAVYNHLVRPNELSNSSDYSFFRAHIKPMWEDPANKAGGKFMLRLRKGFASRYWEDLLFAALGEQLGVGDRLCGVSVSVRYNEDILSVWHKDANDAEVSCSLFFVCFFFVCVLLFGLLQISICCFILERNKRKETKTNTVVKNRKNCKPQEANQFILFNILFLFYYFILLSFRMCF